jgi:hypothetical protein
MVRAGLRNTEVTEENCIQLSYVNVKEADDWAYLHLAGEIILKCIVKG